MSSIYLDVESGSVHTCEGPARAALGGRTLDDYIYGAPTDSQNITSAVPERSPSGPPRVLSHGY